jgi:hypothetical protein
MEKYVLYFTYKFIVSGNIEKLAFLKKCPNIWRTNGKLVK